MSEVTTNKIIVWANDKFNKMREDLFGEIANMSKQLASINGETQLANCKECLYLCDCCGGCNRPGKDRYWPDCCIRPMDREHNQNWEWIK